MKNSGYYAVSQRIPVENMDPKCGEKSLAKQKFSKCWFYTALYPLFLPWFSSAQFFFLLMLCGYTL